MADLIKKDVSYLGKDFAQIRKNLIEFSKTYFPNTYNDFNEASPGMMFMEMSAYVGDVLSFYTDVQLKESMIQHASEKKNLLSLAYSLGYRPKNVTSATVDLDIFQLIPSVGSAGEVAPDWSYALKVEDGLVVKSETTDSEFRTVLPVDFAYSSSLDPTDVTVYSINDVTKEPEFYLLKKKVKAVSGKIESSTFTFTSPKIYDKITLNVENIVELVDVIDDDGNKWYEVPYLGQDTIFESVQNTAKNDVVLSQYRSSAPYLLKLKKVSRRFTTKYKSDDSLEIQFGAGISDNADEELIPNPDLVGTALPGRDRDIDVSLDPSNFLYTKTYGLAPANTTLTVRYTTGNGINDNVPSNDLTDIKSKTLILDDDALDTTLVNQIKASVAVTNPEPAKGGKFKETETEIRNNALSNFASQNRAITKEDYLIRAYSMPPRFGAVAKAHIVQDDQLSNITPSERVPNPFALNMYLLGQDENGYLTTLNPAVKENLKTYMNQYRIMTDGINLKDAFIVNIGFDFEIITLPEYNSNEVLIRCVNKIKQIFNIKNWQINQPIVLKHIEVELDKIEGVQTVSNLEVTNKIDTASGYAGNIYDIKEATKNGIIYPSIDPMMFEVKFKDADIRGRVVSV
jgi:hypothetical protein